MKVVTLGFVVVILALCGCVTNVQRYAAIDATEKTVTVPAGSKGLKGALKNALSEMGWKLAVDRGPSVVEGDLGEKTKLESYDTFNTRYRLRQEALQVDICFNLQPLFEYDIAFIDNRTGSEVFTIEGRGCEGGVVAKFRDVLTGSARTQ